MVDIVKIILPVVKGVVFFGVLAIIFYGFYRLLKLIGFFRIFKRKVKVSQEVYVDVADQIEQGARFRDIAEYFSKFPKRIQNQYIQAYYEIKSLKGGGKDGQGRIEKAD